ncbi:uncharacterized protein LOC134655226 [Cydia amplana]|uniref:uncharacterized protein LOC134655226 n=1 Tax=Cydia amplana TaxID=1869771 RepID=UPI002FE6502A
MYYSYKHTAKITPVRLNNFLDNRFFIIRQLRPLIIFQALLGVSRPYLLKPKKIFEWMSYCYSFLAMLLLCYSLLQDNYVGATYIVFKCTSCIEFLILVLSSILLQRRSMTEFFKNLEAFDRVMNIEKDVIITVPMHRPILWLILSTFITTIEFFVIFESNFAYSITNLTIMVHDAEQVFFGTMLRTIFERVRIVKAHVIKVCDRTCEETRKRKNLDKVEALSRKSQHGISSLHEVYESLHKCAEQLNSVMSFPVCTIIINKLPILFVVAVWNTNLTLTLHHSLVILQLLLLVYIFIRCLKYTILVIIPCYYSSKTTTQVSIIRKTLHDALNNDQFDKIDCRRLKAFFQLTCDSEFAYALWGVINLNMSLPLSYISLCTTYLVIIIQFSKFID